MSEELLETLWREFAAETSEHLELMEPLLVNAETAGTRREDIGQLFRSMHSIKGLARAMSLHGMETLAHHAEHLLGLVREGRCGLDSTLVGVLLEALDDLKAMRETATAERRDTPTPEALIARLEAVRRTVEGGGAEAATAAAPAAAPAPAPAPAAAAVPVHDDPETLQFYLEGLQSELPMLARLVGPDLSDAEARDQIRRALEIVRQGADILGFGPLVQLADALEALVPGDDGAPAGDLLAQAVPLLSDLRRELATLEAATGTDAGTLALGQALASSLEQDYEARRLALAGALDSGDAGAVAARAADLYSCLALLDCDQAGNLALMIEDVFSRAASGEVAPTPELLDHARGCLDLLALGMAGDAGGALRLHDLDAERADAALERFRDLLLAGPAAGGGAGPASADRQYLAGLGVGAELLDLLTPEQAAEVAVAMRGRGFHLFEIAACLEQAAEVAAAFVAWLPQHGVAVTNRAVFRDGLPSFEFLYLTALDEPAVTAALRGMDPSGTLVTARAIGGASTAAPAPAPAAAPTPAPAPAETRRREPAKRGADTGGSVLRVRSETIDHFLNAIGEMVMVNNMLDTAIHGEDGRASPVLELKRLLQDLRSHDADPVLLDTLARCIAAIQGRDRRLRQVQDRLIGSLGRLQESALDLRVVPVDTIFSRFPRIVRDMAQAQGKQIRLDLEGGDVRIDKGMVELLVDPLIHMVRNAADHGIEPPDERRAKGKPVPATIRLGADQRDNQVVVEIADDGRGLDLERIRAKAVARGLIGEAEGERLAAEEVFRFIFHPGFSTAAQVTETSGRGVGMDVVYNNVTKLGGAIGIRSTLGAGTTFTLRLPLSAAIQDVLLVAVDDQLLAIPDRCLSEVCEAADGDLQLVHGQPAILLRGQFLPVFHLGELLGQRRRPAAGGLPIMVLTNDRRRIGVQVDRLVRRQELFVKDIHPSVAAIPGVGGAAVLGDGRVVLIMDGGELFELAAGLDGAAAQALQAGDVA